MRLEKGCRSKYARSGAAPIKARFGAQTCILSLVLEIPKTHKEESQMAEGGEPTEVKELHTGESLGSMGVVNPHQAAHHPAANNRCFRGFPMQDK